MVARTYLSIITRYLEEGERIVGNIYQGCNRDAAVVLAKDDLWSHYNRYRQEWANIPPLYIWESRDHEYFLMVDV